MGSLQAAIERYLAKSPARFHMPGHKGKSIFNNCGFSPLEGYDLTEIEGLDNLYDSKGCIEALQQEISGILGFKSIISTGGSTACIQAMLASVCSPGAKVLVDRCVHVSVINCIALLGLKPVWLQREFEPGFAFGKPVSAGAVEILLAEHKDAKCVFLTGEDYYGFAPNIAEISKVCKASGAVLLVDNAHGAYLSFLGAHPMQLGATMCCDSWHKTLPALTGAAVLAMQSNFSPEFVKSKMRLFATTSPSYLTMLSMEFCAGYLKTRFVKELERFGKQVEVLRQEIKNWGFEILNEGQNSLMKLTICGLRLGVSGFELAKLLRANCAEPEYADANCVVLFISPQNSQEDFEKLRLSLKQVKPGAALPESFFCLKQLPETVCEPRKALFAKSRRVSLETSEGCVVGQAVVNCPPCVPIIMPGERVSKEVMQLFKSFGTEFLDVVEGGLL